MNFFLLTMGSNFYPQWADDDWIASFHSEQEAKNAIKEVAHPYNKGDTAYLYIPTGRVYDWYRIIDLKKWIGEKE